MITRVIDANGGDGVLVATGATLGSYTLYVKDRKPVYQYNWFTQERRKVTGALPSMKRRKCAE